MGVTRERQMPLVSRDTGGNYKSIRRAVYPLVNYSPIEESRRREAGINHGACLPFNERALLPRDRTAAPAKRPGLNVTRVIKSKSLEFNGPRRGRSTNRRSAEKPVPLTGVILGKPPRRLSFD